jgi:hypothetical protein
MTVISKGLDTFFRFGESKMQATLTIRQEAVPIVKSSLETRRKSLEFSLRQYRARLAGFEHQHQMTSEQFAARFGAGELGDDAAWFEWEFVLDAARETEQQLELVKSIQP